MAAVGVDISGHTSKPLAGLLHEKFDYVITVCDRVKDACPAWPDAQEDIHCSFQDPAKVEDPDEARLAFVAVRNAIAQRVRLFLLAHRVGAEAEKPAGYAGATSLHRCRGRGSAG